MKKSIFLILFVTVALLPHNNAFALQVSRSIPEEPKPIEAKQPEARQAVKPDTAAKKNDSWISVETGNLENIKVWNRQSNDSLGVYINQPTVRLLGGIAQSLFEQENTSSVSNKLYNVEMDLGWGDVIEFDPEESWFSSGTVRDSSLAKATKLRYSYLGKYDLSGFSLSYVNELEKSNDPGGNMTSMWSFGFLDLTGYGYKFKNGLSVKFLTGATSMWSWLSTTGPAIPVEGETSSLETYPNFTVFDGSVRYGKKYQSEIGLQIGKNISVVANANRMLVYPRTLFWKMTGSQIILGITEGVFNVFTDAIKRNSPNLYPVVDFVLRTGLYFGMSELQKSKSHFPFKSVSPLSVDHIRFGLQFSF